MDRIRQIRERLNQRGLQGPITEGQLLEVLRSLPQRPSLGLPPQADDSRDVIGELVTLRPEHRKILGVPQERLPVRQRPPVRIPHPDQPLQLTPQAVFKITENTIGPEVLGKLVGATAATLAAAPKFTPILRIRVQALVCRQDNGKFTDGGTPQSAQEIGEAIAKTIAAVNEIFDDTGIDLVFYPTADLEIKNDSRLNQDFIIPPSDLAQLRKTPPLTKEEMDALAQKHSTTPYRNQVAQQYRGKLVLLFAEGTTYSFGQPGQPEWRWCKKCQSLFYGGGDQGLCPAGGTHDKSSSGNYVLSFNSPAVTQQDNWRYCHKCDGLFFAGNNAGVCPAGGPHDKTNSFDYKIPFSAPGAVGQSNWRYCKKCQGLFFAGSGNGKCAAGAQHDATGSGHYSVPVNEPNQWGLASPAGGGFSWEDLAFAKLSAWVGNTAADAEGYATFLAHEVGHHLHLWHTFVQFSLSYLQGGDNPQLTDQQRADLLQNAIRKYLEQKIAEGVAPDKVIQTLDGDAAVVSDTPPDDSGELLHYLNKVANGSDACGLLSQVKLTLNNGTKVSYQPDRSLVMSYFKGCLNFNQRFSTGQGQRMRQALTEGNRRHLTAVQLGDTQFPDERACAVWNPNAKNQAYVWGYKLDEFKKKYEEMKNQGMRLYAQQAYTRKGVTRYDAIWNPGTHVEEVIWGWTVQDFSQRAQEMKAKKMRLTHLESYLLPDGQVRINAIWNPGEHAEDWIQGWAPEHFDKKATEMHAKGFRLMHLNAWQLPDKQVRYDALWRPGTHAQWYVRGVNAEGFAKKYGEMWQQQFKLLLLDTHLVNGEIRYNAVWNPNPGAQYVVWGKTREQVRADYDEMWQQGMKLISMSSVRF